MREEMILNFCILPNPFNHKNTSVVFISNIGCNFLNYEILTSKEYINAKTHLEKIGFFEVSPLRFETYNDEYEYVNGKINSLCLFMEELDMVYSRELEVNMVRDFDKLKDTDEDFVFTYDEYCNNSTPRDIEPIENINIDRSSIKIPEIGETISLNMYLFLEFGFNEQSKPVIQFNGSFYSKKTSDEKNYIKIVESEFIRIEDSSQLSTLTFKSKKTQSDFFKEIGMLYSGSFNFKKKMFLEDSIILKESKYNYKLIEIKDYLDLDESINIKTNSIGFERLLQLSDNIKLEKTKEDKRLISIEEIKIESRELSDFLRDKMLDMSSQERYEEAIKLQDNISFIENKISLLDDLNHTEIEASKYYELFSIK